MSGTDCFSRSIAPNYDFIRESLKAGATIAEVCQGLGITRGQWELCTQRYEDFRQFVAEIDGENIDRVEKCLLDLCLGQEIVEEKTIISAEGAVSTQTTVKKILPNIEAAKFYLTNKRPKDWRNAKTVDVQGEVGFKVVLPPPPPGISHPTNNLLEE